MSRAPPCNNSAHFEYLERRARRRQQILRTKVTTVNESYPTDIPRHKSQWELRLRKTTARRHRLHQTPQPLPRKVERRNHEVGLLFALPRELRNAIYEYMVDPGLRETKAFRDSCWQAREELHEQERIYCDKTLRAMRLFEKNVIWKPDYYRRSRFHLYLPGWNIWDLVRVDLRLKMSEFSHMVSSHPLDKKDCDALTTLSTLPGHMVVVTIVIEVSGYTHTIKRRVLSLEHRIRLFLANLGCRAEVAVRTKLIYPDGSGEDIVSASYMLRQPLSICDEWQRGRLLAVLA